MRTWHSPIECSSLFSRLPIWQRPATQPREFLKTANGRPDLTAAAPKTPDGNPDLFGNLAIHTAAGRCLERSRACGSARRAVRSRRIVSNVEARGQKAVLSWVGQQHDSGRDQGNGNTLQRGTPVALFPERIAGGGLVERKYGGRQFDVSSDGPFPDQQGPGQRGNSHHATPNWKPKWLQKPGHEILERVQEGNLKSEATPGHSNAGSQGQTGEPERRIMTPGSLCSTAFRAHRTPSSSIHQHQMVGGHPGVLQSHHRILILSKLLRIEFLRRFSSRFPQAHPPRSDAERHSAIGLFSLRQRLEQSALPYAIECQKNCRSRCELGSEFK